MDRVILHCDLNSFYASVEELFHPNYHNKPLAVGGSSADRHGIILAKNQLAKTFKVKTAEPLWLAKQKCPDLIICPPNFDVYMKYSKLVQAIYQKYTNKIESFGIDECWLDISDSYHLFGSPKHCAFMIKEEIKATLGLTISIGISFNKVYAKLGSDLSGIDEVTYLNRNNKEILIYPLAVGNLLFVGTNTNKKLKSFGVNTIGDLAQCSNNFLDKNFGKIGRLIKTYALGNDNSEVTNVNYNDTVKSISHSTTTSIDMENYQDGLAIFTTLAQAIASRAKSKGLKGSVVAINYRYANLKNYTYQMSLNTPTNLSKVIYEKAKLLLKKHWTTQQPLRSIGITLKNLTFENDFAQVNLFSEEDSDKDYLLDKTLDNIRNKYGFNKITYANAQLNNKSKDTKNITDPKIDIVGWLK